MNKPNISVQQGFAQRHRRSVLAVAVLIILSVVLACLVMTCGNTYYSLAEVWNILTSEGTKGAAFTIKTLRLPKMLVGILAGIAFGMSGNTFQTLLRNPLASPDIIGVTSGASAAAVFCILMLKWSGGIVSLVAVLAGLFVAALIYLLARDRHGYSGGRMILIGIGMQAMLNALISWMLLKGSEYDVATALRWLRGSLNGVQMSDVPVLSITVLVGGFILIVLNRSLQVMQLGEEYPITLGAPVQRVRLGLHSVRVASYSCSNLYHRSHRVRCFSVRSNRIKNRWERTFQSACFGTGRCGSDSGFGTGRTKSLCSAISGGCYHWNFGCTVSAAAPAANQ